MKIIVSSLNKTKINAVKNVYADMEVIACEAASNVSEQPMSDEETRTGAINRAKNSHKAHPEAITIGLEGGVMQIGNELYLTNWGALILPSGRLYTAAGARISLPNEFISRLAKGAELSEIMDVYAKQADIRSNAGAIGIFTKDYVSRTDLFTHLVKLLRGQMEYNA